MNEAAIQSAEAFAAEFADSCLRVFVRLCENPGGLSQTQLDAACEAMREEAKREVDILFRETKEIPWMADALLATARLTVAHAGLKAIRATV